MGYAREDEEGTYLFGRGELTNKDIDYLESIGWIKRERRMHGMSSKEANEAILYGEGSAMMTTIEAGEEPVSDIHTAMIKIMEECAYAKKDRKNQFLKYDYASEASFLKVVRPAMVRHHVYMTTSITSVENDEHGNTNIMCNIRFTHAPSKTYFEIEMAGSGNDKARNGSVGDKGVYKALTGATKYALFKTFLIATGDDPEVANEQEQAEIVPIKDKDWAVWFRELTEDLVSCGSRAEVDTVAKKHADSYRKCLTSDEELAKLAKQSIEKARKKYNVSKPEAEAETQESSERGDDAST